MIAILGLLVFILTLFCMKQQNDYSLLMNEHHKQNITIQKLEGELKKDTEQLQKDAKALKNSKKQSIK